MATLESRLPEISPAATGESDSKRAFERRLAERFMVRFGDGGVDYGCDGDIEVKRRQASGRLVATNRRAYFQLKHAAAARRLKDGSVSHEIEVKNVLYLGVRRPALYVLYLRDEDALLYRWWHDVHAELERERPGWQAQDRVAVRFRRPLDDAALADLAREIDVHARQEAAQRDGPSFRRYVGGEAMRELLQPEPAFVGREPELAALARGAARGAVVPVAGPPDAGKSELARQFLSDPSVLGRLEDELAGPLAALALDVGPTIGRRLLRSLSFALGASKAAAPADFEGDDDGDVEHAREHLLRELLPSRLQGCRPLLLVENAHHCLDGDEREDLDELLGSDALRSGVALVLTRYGTVPDGRGRRTRREDLVLGPLPTADAARLLSERGADPAAAAAALADAAAEPELLLPGVLRRGADRAARSVDGGAPAAALLEALLDAATETVRAQLADLGCARLWDDGGALAPLATLLALALFPLPIGADGVDQAGLPQPPWGDLERLGWSAPADGVAGLTDTGRRALRARARQALRAEPGEPGEPGAAEALEQAAGRLLAALQAGARESAFEPLARAVEAAIAWLREKAPSAHVIEARLVEALLPYVVDDLVFPLAPVDARRVEDRLAAAAGADRLAPAVAALALAARLEKDPERFLACLRQAVDAAQATARWSGYHLRALDLATFLGQRRHRRLRDIFVLRQELAPRLAELAADGEAEIGARKWAASWLLNTAALALGLGEVEAAAPLLAGAGSAIDALPAPTAPHAVVGWLWLRSRLSQLAARLERDGEVRLRTLRQAMDEALLLLASSTSPSHWLRFALRAVRRVADELVDDEERQRAIDGALARLAEVFGAREEWALGVRAQAAALQRDVAALGADPADRLAMAERAVALLVPAAEEALALARLGDDRALLVLARSLALVGSCREEMGEEARATADLRQALRWVEEALAAVPSAAAWELRLELIDQLEPAARLPRPQPGGLTTPQIRLGPELRHAMAECRRWLRPLPAWSRAESRLAFWCQQRHWQAQGSLERWAAANQPPETEWNKLGSRTRRHLLAGHYDQRRRLLDALGRRSGPLLELQLARVRLEAQYQRLIAIYSDHVCDAGPVLAHFRAAESVWPDSHTLLAEVANFHRYTWSYPEAITTYRQVLRGAPGGSLRREATVRLAETLLTAATHCEELTPPDGTRLTADELVTEARGLLADVAGYRRAASESAMLRDRADLEADQPIDWQAIDEVYRLVVGDVDRYLETLVENVDAISSQDPVLPQRLADLVRQNCTSPDVLRGLGSLYLRRAEKGGSDDPLRDCRRAYAVFQACGLLEKWWQGRERPTTSYQRGRAILGAAATTRSAQPFAANLETKGDLLELAERLLQRATSLSVGLFHLEARRRLGEVVRLRRELVVL